MGIAKSGPSEFRFIFISGPAIVGPKLDYGVVAVLSADGDPLIDAADGNEHRFVDAVRRVDGEGSGVLVLADRAVRNGAQDQNDEEPEKAQYGDFRYPPKLARHRDFLVSRFGTLMPKCCPKRGNMKTLIPLILLLSATTGCAPDHNGYTDRPLTAYR